MTNRKTIRLTVVIPDPREWCDDGRGLEHCPLLSKSYDRCTVYARCCAGHAVRRSGYYRFRRPQSCRDAEVQS